MVEVQLYIPSSVTHTQYNMWGKYDRQSTVILSPIHTIFLPHFSEKKVVCMFHSVGQLFCVLHYVCVAQFAT